MKIIRFDVLLDLLVLNSLLLSLLLMSLCSVILLISVMSPEIRHPKYMTMKLFTLWILFPLLQSEDYEVTCVLCSREFFFLLLELNNSICMVLSVYHFANCLSDSFSSTSSTFFLFLFLSCIYTSHQIIHFVTQERELERLNKRKQHLHLPR
jgi:hypothetical protein